MKKIFAILLVGIATTAFVVKTDSQHSVVLHKQSEGGIKFKTMSFEKAKSAAGESDKLIFVDAYTTWCGPCKRMAATSFKEEEVGEIFNSKFINLKIDCESDEGKEFARIYKVRAYPTLLLINGDGKVVKQTMGFMTADQLIAFANSVD
jgi:thiol-disulfide isomerase/thioredoxin